MKNKIFNKKINKLEIGLLLAAALLSLIQVSSPFAMDRGNQESVSDINNLEHVEVEQEGIKYELNLKTKEAKVKGLEEFGTTKLSQCNIPNKIQKCKVIEISDEAFIDCKELEEVTIGKYVKTIGNGAFGNVSYKCNIKFKTANNGRVMFGNNSFGNAQISYYDDTGTVNIHDNYLHIIYNYYNDETFRYKLNHNNHTAKIIRCLNNDLIEVTINDSILVKYNNEKIPYRITTVLSGVLNNHEKLKTVKIEGKEKKEISFEGGAFENLQVVCCDDDYEVVIDEKERIAKIYKKCYVVNNIKYRLNHENNTATVVECLNEKAKKIEICDLVEKNYKVTEIQEKVFAGCKFLKTVNIGGYITKIGAKAFVDAGIRCNINFKYSDEKEIEFEEDAFGKAKIWCANDYYEPKKEGNTIKFFQMFIDKNGIKYRLNHKNKTATVYSCLNEEATTVTLENEIAVRYENENIRYKVERIERVAFDGCKNLKKVVIGEYVKRIGDGAFWDADRNCNIVFDGQCEREINLEGKEIFDDAVFSCSDDIYEVIKTDDKIIICQKYLETKDMVYELNYKDRTAKVIGCIDNSIESLDLTEVRDKHGIVLNVIEVADEACINCKNLNNVQFGNSIKKIGKKAFENVPESCKIIFNIKNETDIQLGNRALGKSVVVCSDEEKFNINVKKGGILVEKIVKKTETIGDLKYELNIAKKRATVTECINKEVSSIEIPKSVYVSGSSIYCEVNAIADKAFDGCTKLDMIIVGKNINTIGKDILAKTGTPGMEITHGILALKHGVGSKIKIDKKLKEDKRIIPCNDNKERKNLSTKFYETNGDCYVEVYQRFFVEDENFKYELKCDEGEAKTAKIVRCRNKDLTEVNIPYYISCYIDHGATYYNLTEIGEEAFKDCINLIEIKMPNSVTKIGKRAFDECVELTRIEIPEGITEISGELFSFCEKLTEIEIPKTVKIIRKDAFEGCNADIIFRENKKLYIDEECTQEYKGDIANGPEQDIYLK